MNLSKVVTMELRLGRKRSELWRQAELLTAEGGDVAVEQHYTKLRCAQLSNLYGGRSAQRGGPNFSEVQNQLESRTQVFYGQFALVAAVFLCLALVFFRAGGAL